MQNRKTIFAIGLIFFLMPVLGFPGGFESFLQFLGGLLIMFFASRKSLERRIVKDKRPRRRKEKNPVFIESESHEPSGEAGNMSTSTNEVSENNT